VSLFALSELTIPNPCQSISSFLSAYDSGIAGGILTFKSFEEDFRYAKSTASRVSSLTVGLEQLGSFIAAALVYPITNRYGRKRCIIGSTALFVIGVVIQVINTRSLAAWYVGRIVAGLGMGGQSVVIPMYSAEMTPKEIRGRCGSFYQWLYAWGVFVAYWVDYVSIPYSWKMISTHILTRAWPKTHLLLAPHGNGRSPWACS
jgi:MFS family permease